MCRSSVARQPDRHIPSSLAKLVILESSSPESLFNQRSLTQRAL